MRNLTFAAGVMITAVVSPVLAQPAAPANATAVPQNAKLGTGPYQAVMEMDATLPDHTVYHPANLSALGSKKLPIVVWGNGTCSNNGNMFRWFLSEIASHGYLVIASGPIGPASVEVWPPPRPAGEPAPVRPANAPQTPRTTSSQLNEAITWASAENTRRASAYLGKLEPSKVAVMGQSCGGIQAIEASADKRATTTMIWNSGLPSTPSTMGGGMSMTKDNLKLIHTPVAYISGDQQDQAWANANDDFEHIEHVPIFRAYEKGVPHAGTYGQVNGGGFAAVAVAWLDWQLKGDAKASKTFVGKNCALCVNPKWVVNKKKID